jgi:hypothetical protein
VPHALTRSSEVELRPALVKHVPDHPTHILADQEALLLEEKGEPAACRRGMKKLRDVGEWKCTASTLYRCPQAWGLQLTEPTLGCAGVPCSLSNVSCMLGPFARRVMLMLIVCMRHTKHIQSPLRPLGIILELLVRVRNAQLRRQQHGSVHDLPTPSPFAPSPPLAASARARVSASPPPSAAT